MSIPIPYVIPKTRKGLKILILILLIVCIGLTLFAYFSWSADQQILKENGQPSFNTLPLDRLKSGLIVKGDIDLALDSFAEMYKTDNFGNRTSDKSESLYYLIPIYDVTAEGSLKVNYVITFKAEKKDIVTLDKIYNQTWRDTKETTTLTVENADIVNMPGDIKQYLTDWAHDPGLFEGGSFIDWCLGNNIFETGDRAVIESKLVPYMIVRTSTAGTDPAVIWVMLALTIFALAVLLFLIFHKGPIEGIEDPPVKDEFRKVREFTEE